MSKKPCIPVALHQSFTEILEKYARPGIDFKLHLSRKALPLGCTKVGGCPDVGPGFEWPTFYDPTDEATRPLSFLAQVNLAETAPLDQQHALPITGILLFFYDMQSYRWGAYPEDAGSARCIYVEDTGSLERAAFPDELEDEFRFSEYAVSLKSVLIAPDFGNMDDECEADVVRLGGDWSKGAGIYRAVRSEYRGYESEFDCGTYLFGYPDIIQDAMEEECAEVHRKRELGLGGDDDLPESEREAIKQASTDWVLLFQLSSDMMDSEHDFDALIDTGTFYFWIRKDDLASCRFDKVWLMGQIG